MDKEKKNYPYVIIMMTYIFLFAMVISDLFTNPSYGITFPVMP
jgi:hypothetical protein